MMTRPAVVLTSGGLDSTTTLAIARAEGFAPHALTFDYGQRHSVEIEAAHRVALAMGVIRHEIVTIDLRAFGGSALTDDLDVPKADGCDDGPAEGIPVTYVPARNTIFLAFALAFAETIGAQDIFIGVNAVDYSGYPDCRPEYIEAWRNLATLATKAAVTGEARYEIHTPLISLSKADIIARGMELCVDYSLTSSCYDPDEGGRPCGRCDSCRLRLRGFEAAGVPDPLEYADGVGDRS